MPVEADSAGLSATARVALPIRVYCSSAVVTSSAAMASTKTTTSLGVISSGPISHGVHRGVLRVVAALRAGEVLVEVAQEDRQTDAHDHHRDDAGAAAAQRVATGRRR